MLKWKLKNHSLIEDMLGCNPLIPSMKNLGKKLLDNKYTKIMNQPYSVINKYILNKIKHHYSTSPKH